MSELKVPEEDLAPFGSKLCANRSVGLSNAECWTLIERIARVEAENAALRRDVTDEEWRQYGRPLEDGFVMANRGDVNALIRARTEASSPASK